MLDIPEEQLNKAAEAMHRAVLDHIFVELETRQFDEQEPLLFFRSCLGESDRASPILLFSYLEAALESELRRELNPRVPGGLKELFGATGPLATTSARIKMLSALNWLSLETARELEIFRKLRNVLAHTPSTAGLREPKAQSYFQAMRKSEAPIANEPFLLSINLRPNPDVSTKELLIARAALLYTSMMQELITAPRCQRSGLDPRAGVSVEFHKGPTILKKVRNVGIGIALSILACDSDGNHIVP